jgi:hypothetical protein
VKVNAHARGAAVVILLVAALVPELRRYRAERTIYNVIGVLQILAQNPRSVPDVRAALRWARDAAAAAAADAPFDQRPLFLQASAHLMGREVPEAVALYRRAIAIEERAETDLDLGKALTFLKRADEGRAAGLRAGWVHPWVLDALPRDLAAPLRETIAGLEQDLVAGRMSAPPALPPASAGP